jgi:hypothetical protein
MSSETFTQRYDKALAAERLRPSKQHKEAMDYIYDREDFTKELEGLATDDVEETLALLEDSDQPGVHEAFDQEYNDEEETQCRKCKRGVNLYNEAIFVVGIYVNDVRESQEFWCKQCAVKGMKWSNKHPLLRGDL